MPDAADLLAAIQARDAPRALDLLATQPDLAGARTPEGMSVLQLALYVRLSRVVDALLAAGAPVGVHEAAILGDAARVRELVRKDLALVSAPGADGFPPLHLAAHFGRMDALAALLNLGADPDARGGPPLGNMALHAACAGGQDEAAEALLRAGAAPDAADASGYAPLMIAAANGRVGIVRALLARGADPTRTGPDGKTARDHALARDEDEVARILAGLG